jgi:predicted acyl esterase
MLPVLDVLHPPGSSGKTGALIDLERSRYQPTFGAVSHRPGRFVQWSKLQMHLKMVYVPPAYMDRPFYQLSWELLRWFDYWLKGLDTGIMNEPAVKIFVTGSNEWLNALTIQCHTKWIPFNLHENHSLCEIEPWPDAETASYDDAPANRGFLKYYSPPLVENTEIVGSAALYLYASARGTDMNIFAGIWDCDPEGKETCMARGYLKASHRELDPELSQPWHPVPKHTHPEKLVPGQVYKLAIGFADS